VNWFAAINLLLLPAAAIRQWLPAETINSGSPNSSGELATGAGAVVGDSEGTGYGSWGGMARSSVCLEVYSYGKNSIAAGFADGKLPSQPDSL
jgi:hypothetical protein